MLTVLSSESNEPPDTSESESASLDSESSLSNPPDRMAIIATEVNVVTDDAFGFGFGFAFGFAAAWAALLVSAPPPPTNAGACVAAALLGSAGACAAAALLGLGLCFSA